MLIQLLLPIFALIGLGFALTRLEWVPRSSLDGAGNLVAKVLIPCLLFNGSLKFGLPQNAASGVLPAFYIPVTILFGLQAFWLRHSKDPATLPFISVYSNTVFVGIPVLVKVFGESSLATVFPIIAFHGLLTFSLFYMTSAWQSSSGSRVLQIVKRTLSNPIVLSLLLGLTGNYSRIQLPAALQEILSMLGTAALPCALLALGASLSGFTLSDLPKIAPAVTIKLLLLPALIMISGKMLFALPNNIIAVETILAACPIAINAYPIVQAEGRNAGQSGSAILLSSLLCAITLPLWIRLIGHLP